MEDPPPADPTPPTNSTPPAGNNPTPPPPNNNPGNPNVPADPESPEAPGNQVNVWGLTRVVSRGRLLVSIGAHNLPSTFTLQVNNRKFTHRRLNNEQFSFAASLKNLGKRAKTVMIQLRSGQSVLLTVRMQLKSGQWRQL